MSRTDLTTVQQKSSRFRPANSNDAARAVLSHHFTEVPACSFGRDDGISSYLGSDSTIENYPHTPAEHEALHDEVPPIKQEQSESRSRLARRLLRSGFALSVVIHAVAAVAITYVTVTLPDEDMLIEGATVITMVVEGESEVNQTAEGEEKAAQEPVEPVTEPVSPGIERKKAVEPEPAKEPDIVKQLEPIKMPEPVLVPVKIEEPVAGAQIAETLTARDSADQKIDVAAKPAPIEVQPEKKVEALLLQSLAQPLRHPVSKVRAIAKPVEIKQVAEKKVKEKPAEKRSEPKPEPKPKKVVDKKPDKKPLEKPVKSKRTVKGNKGDTSNNARKGETDVRDKGEAANDNSRGDATNRDKGNAARSNYKGLVQKKLQRAKSRVRVAAKGNVTVAFTITAGGGVTNVRITRSSGKVAIDKGALDIVRKASPFPPIPAETGKKSWVMSVPISFK